LWMQCWFLTLTFFHISETMFWLSFVLYPDMEEQTWIYWVYLKFNLNIWVSYSSCASLWKHILINKLCVCMFRLKGLI
jgi:hypothetical protein